MPLLPIPVEGYSLSPHLSDLGAGTHLFDDAVPERVQKRPRGRGAIDGGERQVNRAAAGLDFRI